MEDVLLLVGFDFNFSGTDVAMLSTLLRGFRVQFAIAYSL